MGSTATLTLPTPTALLEQVPAAVWVLLAVLAAIIIIIVAGLNILRLVYRSQRIYPAVFQKHLFKITVPQRVKQEEDERRIWPI